MGNALIRLIFFGLLFLAGMESFAQTESAPFKERFWQSYVLPFADGNTQVLDTVVHFPLDGDWGHMMHLKKEREHWTRQDFYENYHLLFNPRVKEIILKKGSRNVSVWDWEEGPKEIVYTIDWEDYGFESQILLRFRKIDQHWQLTNIQGAG